MSRRAAWNALPPAGKPIAELVGAGIKRPGLVARSTTISTTELAADGRPRLLQDAPAPSFVYLHPAAKGALGPYAVERGVKVHDLLLKAIESWASQKGLAGPWRVPSSGPPRRRRGKKRKGRGEGPVVIWRHDHSVTRSVGHGPSGGRSYLLLSG